ncbi:MAG: PKD domain-containing protein [Bacteroidia bacterium]
MLTINCFKIIAQTPTESNSYKITRAPSCNNLDFATGTTTGWVAAWCDKPGVIGASNSNYNLSANTLPAKSFNSSGTTNQKNFVHEIMTAGNDPNTQLSTVPPGHSYSLRLGKDQVGANNHQMIANTFTVDAANPTITYWYSVVFQQDQRAAPHLQKDQPYFKIKVFDKNNKPINCANYDVDATKGATDGFKTNPIDFLTEAVYKDWTPVYIPLTDYIGQQVTIQFESSDCAQGAHFGYAYLAVDCGPFKGITTTPYICGDKNIKLVAPNGATTYQWSGPGVIAPVDQKEVNINAPGKYTVKMTIKGNDGTECTFAVDTLISNNATLPIALFSNTSVCAGQPLLFKDESTPKDSITAWSWDFNNDGIEDSNIQNPTNVYSTNGTFPVTLKIQQGACKAEIKKNVIVVSGATLIITNPIADCSKAGADLTLPAVTAGSSGATDFTYWMDAAATVPLTNATSITLSGTYYIKAGTGTCSDIKPVKVTFNEKPVANAGLDVNFCTGDSAIIGSPALPDYSYLWILASGGTATGLSSNTIANPTVKLNNTGATNSTTNYIVQVTNMLTGCKGTDTVNVTVKARPTANAGASQSICIGTPIKLNGSIGGGASSAIWKGGTGSYNKDSTQLDGVYTPSGSEYSAGSVKLTLVTNNAGGTCSFASSDVVLNFYKSPVIHFVVNQPTGCPVHCIKLLDSSQISMDKIEKWEWDFGDASPKGMGKNPSHCYENPGFYDITLTATSNLGCSSTIKKSRMIEVFNTPTAEFTASPNPLQIINPEVFITNQSSLDAVYWHYNFGDKDTLAPAVASPKHLYSKEKPGAYLITLIVKNANGCSDTVSHEIKVLPEFTFFMPNAFTPQFEKDGNNDLFYGKGVGIEKYNFWIFDRWGNLLFYTQDLKEGWDGKVKNKSKLAQQDVYVWKVKLTDALGQEHNYTGTVTLIK